MELRTEIEIAAPPAAVWQVLTDFSRYGEWNPFLASVEGTLKVGSELRVVVSPPGGREYHMIMRLITCEPERELRWRGKWGADFLFRGEHFFRLVPLEHGHTRFVHGEDFGGILVRWLGQRLTQVARGFVFMNQALKRQVEHRNSNDEAPGRQTSQRRSAS